MKVYILGDQDYDGLQVYGVYSTKELALEAAPYFVSPEYDRSIFEYDLDAPNKGEKIQKIHYSNLFSDGDIKNASFFDKPSNREEISFGTDHGDKRVHFVCGGSGLTLKSAIENRKKAVAGLSPVWQISDSGIEVRHYHPSNLFDWGVRYGEKKSFFAVHADRNVCIIALEEYKKGGTRFAEFLTIHTDES